MSKLLEAHRIRTGGAPKYHEKLKESNKLFARHRIELLCDRGSFVEDGLFANCLDEELPADGVITGLGKVLQRSVAIMANDSTVKAGSWGARTVEKILRIQEQAGKLEIPLFYLVDSAGARITDQVQMFPGRRGAGRIFYHQANLSGRIPQICLLFGPSAAGGAYIPAFCDVVFMVRANASMYLGSPRMAEAVIGEKISLEEMGGASMHCTVSGCGDFLVPSEQEAIERAKTYFSYMPPNFRAGCPLHETTAPERDSALLASILPETGSQTYDMREVIRTLVDGGSFFEIKELYAKEVITALARVEGRTIGVVANQPLVKGGVLFVDSADKAARFIQHCDAFGIPLLFLADVPGFMIGSKVEREGIIRAGAKMIYCVSRAVVPKISLIVRKAYGAGLYAMCGPAFATDCVLALPTAQIAVMGPQPAVHAVYYNKFSSLPEAEKKAFIAEKIARYEQDVNVFHLASELVVDALVDFIDARKEIASRFAFYTDRRSKETPTGLMPM